LTESSPWLDDCAQQEPPDTAIQRGRIWLKQRSNERKPHHSSHKIGAQQPWRIWVRTVLRFVFHDGTWMKNKYAAQKSEPLVLPNNYIWYTNNATPAAKKGLRIYIFVMKSSKVDGFSANYLPSNLLLNTSALARQQSHFLLETGPC
jgi:hypothetical protein